MTTLDTVLRVQAWISWRGAAIQEKSDCSIAMLLEEVSGRIWSCYWKHRSGGRLIKNWSRWVKCKVWCCLEMKPNQTKLNQTKQSLDHCAKEISPTRYSVCTLHHFFLEGQCGLCSRRTWCHCISFPSQQEHQDPEEGLITSLKGSNT